jgi:hypothetical protein
MEKMAYSIIQPPFTLKFEQMPKGDLVACREWFHTVKPARIVELTRAVTAGVKVVVA